MKIAFLTQIVLISIIFTSCKHDRYDVHGCGKFDSYEDVKAFGFFNTGTYWVYENQQTLERDTFIVYESQLGYDNGMEVGFLIRMKRSYVNSDFRYYHNSNQNVFPADNNCERRRIWMSRDDFNENGQVISSEESKLSFPIIEGTSEYSYSSCGVDGYGGNVIIYDIEEKDILEYPSVRVFSSEGQGFSLNPCLGETYRYQFGQGIGLISWENLDSMNGKWELIQFEPQ